jgi:hypothetical protein
MISEIRYMRRSTGEMPRYETADVSDATVSHTTFASLCAVLRRSKLRIVCIRIHNDEIFNDTSYAEMTPCIQQGSILTVLYAEGAPPSTFCIG